MALNGERFRAGERDMSRYGAAGPRRHEFVLENGAKFFIRRYDVFLSYEVFGDVQRDLLAPFALFIEANDENLPPEQRVKDMVTAVEKFSHTMDGQTLKRLVRRVLIPDFVSVSIDGGEPEKLDEGLLNLATEGNIFDATLLVVEVLKYNYQDFLLRGARLIGRVQPAQPASRSE